MINSDALYYPHCSFSNPSMIKAMALFYENIYRIVPASIVPNDSKSIKPLLEDGTIGKIIDPMPYASAASDDFLKNLEHWNAAGLSFSTEDRRNISKLHIDKVDERVNRLFEELGCEQSDEWLHVPVKYASNYMLYLAKVVGARNQLNLVAREWAPWTATTYFTLDGQMDEFVNTVDPVEPYPDDPFALFGLILSEIVPLNISEIPAHKIMYFRAQRHDEIARLREAISNLHDELESLDDPIVRKDRIFKKIDELKDAKDEYQKSADLIKAKGWFGVNFMGFTAPVTLAQLFHMPSTETVILAGTSLALGAVFTITSTRHKLEALRKESSGSCLVELRRCFTKYTSIRGGGDMNFHAYNCMEEYVND